MERKEKAGTTQSQGRRRRRGSPAATIATEVVVATSTQHREIV
jgi:hypothetical protein